MNGRSTIHRNRTVFALVVGGLYFASGLISVVLGVPAREAGWLLVVGGTLVLAALADGRSALS